jgi:hypothetical protein
MIMICYLYNIYNIHNKRENSSMLYLSMLRLVSMLAGHLIHLKAMNDQPADLLVVF